jgi:hypothetical protein
MGMWTTNAVPVVLGRQFRLKAQRYSSVSYFSFKRSVPGASKAQLYKAVYRILVSSALCPWRFQPGTYTRLHVLTTLSST